MEPAAGQLPPPVEGRAAQSGSARVVSRARRTAVLVVACLALMMVISAVSGLNVALSSLARQTGATDTQLQWIVDAYTLTFAGLLLPFGNAGDRFGRRLMLTGGTVVFGAGMLTAAASHDTGLLIAARAVAGVGAAAVMPATLAIITSVFPPAERGRAVGVWAGVAGGSALVGLLVSGALLQAFAVSSIFVFNAVLAAVVVAATLVVVPRTGRIPSPPLDPGGSLLSAG